MPTFDVPFLIGMLLVLASLGVAIVAMGGGALPIIGSGRGELIAVAVVAQTGCAIATISLTTWLGWPNPLMIFGHALGVVALVFLAAGIFDWDGVLRPLASLGPDSTLANATTAQLASVMVVGLIAVRFVIFQAIARAIA